MTPYSFGSRAFKDGMKCIPALDKDFLTAHIPNGQTNANALEEWLQGWSNANWQSDVVERLLGPE